MKAIGIVGSPRKNGNVDTLVQAVLDGAGESGYETKKFYLNEMKYSGCQACNYCKANDHCRLDDDVSKLLTEVKRAAAHPAAELAGHARRRRIKTERG